MIVIIINDDNEIGFNEEKEQKKNYFDKIS